jgi:pilus assembly protein Flp/PilA
MEQLLARFLREDEGQDLIEYALLAGFIALATVMMLFQIGRTLNTLFSNVNSQLSSGGS